MRSHIGLSLQRRSAAVWRTGNCRHSARASNVAVKPEPGRAHGTLGQVVLPQLPQATRDTSACSQTLNWK
jgi:hypothetical protein